MPYKVARLAYDLWWSLDDAGNPNGFVLPNGTVVPFGSGAVSSVNAQTGAVVLTAAQVGADPARTAYTWAGKPAAGAGNIGQVIVITDQPAGFRSEWINSDGTQWLPVSAVITNTDASTTAGLTTPTLSYRIQVFAPATSPAGAIRFARIDRYEYTTAQANSGAGHTGAGLDWFVQKSTGNPFFALAHESKVDNEVAAATITLAVAEESQMSRNDGTVTTFIGQRSRITANAGNVGTFIGNQASVAANAGTISALWGTHFPDHSAIAGITSKLAYVNSDPAAPMVSASVIVDSSNNYASPNATGQTVTVPAYKRRTLITPAADYAAQTWRFPPKATVQDGQQHTFLITKGVAALTYDANGASLVFGGPTVIPAGGAFTVVEFTYFAAVDWWVRSST